ncbi:Vgb family protein [Tomitella gaofuii]|uniref:Vgb family protein n=1 Tax=Tomitella gaofuii TaxID=2760083 RepID=UPI0015FACFD5|nr:hypothetical protein [Tomitella gaofuii]
MAQQIGSIDVFRDPENLIESPCGIIAAGDDVWFTSIANDRVGRVRPAGGVRLPGSGAVRIETFADPHGRMRLPANLFPDADGRIRVTCLGSDSVAAIDPHAADPASTITAIRHPDLRGPVAIKSAPTGLLWFSLRGADAIGSLDPRAPDPAATVATVRSGLIADPSALFVDAHGLVWWVNAATATIGRLDPSARRPVDTVARFGPWPRYGAPRAWAPGASDDTGELWVTTQNEPGLLRIAPTARGAAPGPLAATWYTDPPLRTPDGVWTAPDGTVWLADTDGDALVRFTPATGRWERFTAPGVEGPFDIKPGPEPAYLWFTNKRGGSIGRIRVVGGGDGTR